jgi:hypothetical protein
MFRIRRNMNIYASAAMPQLALLTRLAKKAEYIDAISIDSENINIQNIPVPVITPAQVKSLEEVACLLRFQTENRLLESLCFSEIFLALQDNKARWPLTKEHEKRTSGEDRVRRKREASVVKRANACTSTPVRQPLTPVPSS